MAAVVRIFAAEFVGTLLLTFLSAGAIIQSVDAGNFGPGLLSMALAYGIAYAIAVSVAGAASGGHVNPAVSVALCLTGRLRASRLPIYLAAQLLGGLGGAALLRPMFSTDVLAAASFGTPVPADGLGIVLVVLIEAILTLFLVLAFWGTVVDPRGPAMGGFGVGLAVFANVLVGSSISGAGMNPARVFGTAALGGGWNTHVAYWIGPIFGAIAGALYYRYLMYEE